MLMKPMNMMLCAVLLFSVTRGPAFAGEGAMSATEARERLALRQRQFEEYGFDPKSPLESRIGPPPGVLLKNLAAYDKRPDYEPYTPSADEAALLRGYVANLPGDMRDVFQERLLGFYFVKNFIGNGMTGWVIDEQRNLHIWMVLNPSGFSKTVSDILTDRDASVFKGDAGVRVDCGERHKGILYTLLHEGSHAYDFLRGITPFVERPIVDLLRGGKGADASWDVWRRIDEPAKSADFPLRRKLRFFGLCGGPLIEAKDAGRLYDGLMGSPFVLLYSSQSWAEDAADLFTLHFITQKLGQSCVVRVGPGGGGPRTFELMKSERIQERARRVFGKMGG